MTKKLIHPQSLLHMMGLILGTALFISMLMVPSARAAEIGQPAPDFELTDTNGTAHKLSDFKGKTVVLEWTNHLCPYVKKHYSSGNMQKTQQTATSEGVVWLSINSSAKDNQGYLATGEDGNAVIAEQGSNATALLMDADGTVGHLYGAKTTPHMFVIDKEGVLVYAGAIDDHPSASTKGLENAKNYVLAAIDDLKADKPVETSTSQPYGCGVKYDIQ